MLGTLAGWAVAFAAPAGAATITTETLSGLKVVTVTGDILPDDGRRFAEAVGESGAALVILESRGGSLLDGLAIGNLIRQRGLTASVAPGSVCASACALAWLGGRNRQFGDTARIGFHAAYTDGSGRKIAHGVGNALVGSYLANLGLGTPVVIYATMAEPDGMKWLTVADAARLGIDLTVIPSARSAIARPEMARPGMARPGADPFGGEDGGSRLGGKLAAPARPDSLGPPGRPEPLPAIELSTLGSWVQILSRPGRDEAVADSAPFKRRFPDTFVARAARGWHAAVIGPFRPDEADAKLAEWRSRGEIPDDSFVTADAATLDLVWGGLPKGARPPASATGEWIQLLSRSDLADAVAEAREHGRRHASVRVVRHDTDWFVAVIGPFPTGHAAGHLARLRADGTIPRDSFVSQGTRYGDTVWGDAVGTPAVDPRTALDRAARDFVNRYWSTWSSDNVTAIDFLAGAYAPRLTYHGAVKDRGEVLSEKARFAGRWGARRYAARPETVSVACDVAAGRCRVSGTYDFLAENLRGGERSRGAATFTLDLAGPADRLRIASEAGSVLEREREGARPFARN